LFSDVERFSRTVSSLTSPQGHFIIRAVTFANGGRVKKIKFGFWIAVVSLFSYPALARYPSNSADYVRPAFDGGKFVVTSQSQGLYQWGYDLGLNLSYAFEPVEVVPATGAANRVAGVIDDFLVAHVTGAVGLTDWLDVGLDVPIVAYETFFNYVNRDASQCIVTAVCAKQTKTKMGDILFATKLRLLDSDRGMFGLAIQPFISFPTGSGYYMTGYGQFSGGAKVVVDANINRKVYLGLNAGYQVLKNRNYAPDTANANIDDQILLSFGANVPIGKQFAALAEFYGETLAKSPFKHQIQSPFEFLIGARYEPGIIKRWRFSVLGGTGIDKGFGAPGWRTMAQVSYRNTKVVELSDQETSPVSVEAPYEEKIIIMQKIHFEFNKSNVRPVSYPILDDVVKVLEQNPQIRKIRIEGHTDWIGSDAYNMKLSQRRAESVREYLVKKGVSPDRLIATGYGKSRPIADNNTDEGRARNRRTEFTVLDNGGA